MKHWACLQAVEHNHVDKSQVSNCNWWWNLRCVDDWLSWWLMSGDWPSCPFQLTQKLAFALLLVVAAAHARLKSCHQVKATGTTRSISKITRVCKVFVSGHKRIVHQMRPATTTSASRRGAGRGKPGRRVGWANLHQKTIARKTISRKIIARKIIARKTISTKKISNKMISKNSLPLMWWQLAHIALILKVDTATSDL